MNRFPLAMLLTMFVFPLYAAEQTGVQPQDDEEFVLLEKDEAEISEENPSQGSLSVTLAQVEKSATSQDLIAHIQVASQLAECKPAQPPCSSPDSSDLAHDHGYASGSSVVKRVHKSETESEPDPIDIDLLPVTPQKPVSSFTIFALIRSCCRRLC